MRSLGSVMDDDGRELGSLTEHDGRVYFSPVNEAAMRSFMSQYGDGSLPKAGLDDGFSENLYTWDDLRREIYNAGDDFD